MDGGSSVDLSVPPATMMALLIRICISNADGKGQRREAEMFTLRDPQYPTTKLARITVREGWLPAEVRRVGGQYWLVLPKISAGLVVGLWEKAWDNNIIEIETSTDGQTWCEIDRWEDFKHATGTKE